MAPEPRPIPVFVRKRNTTISIAETGSRAVADAFRAAVFVALAIVAACAFKPLKRIPISEILVARLRKTLV